MQPRFKRSLIGYDPTSLVFYVQELETRWHVEREELNKELAFEIHRLELLRVEMAEIKEECEAKLALKREISQKLFSAQVRGVEKLLGAMQAVEQEEKETTGIMLKRKEDLNKLKTYSAEVRRDFYTVANRYKKILDQGEGR